MEFIPDLQLGRMNGWIPIFIFYTLFGLFLLSCPKPIVRKLYSAKGWSKRDYTLSALGKPFALVYLALVILSPLKLGTPIFWIGAVMYMVGFLIMFTALFEYRATPADQPVRSGIYKYSRNPQWVGLEVMFLGTAVACGNGLAILLLLTCASFYHFRILGEEKACEEEYGEPFQDYLGSVSRYF